MGEIVKQERTLFDVKGPVIGGIETVHDISHHLLRDSPIGFSCIDKDRGANLDASIREMLMLMCHEVVAGYVTVQYLSTTVPSLITSLGDRHCSSSS